MKKKIAVWTGLLCVLFSFRVFAGDVIVVVDRFTDIGNKAPVRFSICDSEACHRRKDKGYKVSGNTRLKMWRPESIRFLPITILIIVVS